MMTPDVVMMKLPPAGIAAPNALPMEIVERESIVSPLC